ncbi:MAG: ATP--guanido phosphotransferase [Ruminococcaceae bacterium]|nr:ATP--guanido phosphotransferase [Oscillospiraceae bacterium]
MAWYNVAGTSSDTVISTRVRLARNIQTYPFASRLDANAANEIIEKVSVPLEASGFRKVNFSDISPIMATSYVERHYVSPEFATKDSPHALFLMEQPGIAVMVCEEDHLRIQSILPGLALEEAYKHALNTEKRLDEDFDFSYSEQFGYLTHCPTNLGTGMRASVMMFLPALTRGGYMNSLATQLSKLGLTVRGLFGEGSGSAGCMYQISNQITLGISEEETLHRLGDAVRQISESEQKARKSITGEALERLTDKILRSEGILKYAYMISSSEFIQLFADVRFGITLGIVTDITYEQLGTLLCETMPATLTLSSENTPKGESARDKLRAQKIQKLLSPAEKNA